MKKTYGSKFKSQIALEAMRGDRTIAEIAGEYNLHPNLVSQWKKKLMLHLCKLSNFRGKPQSFYRSITLEVGQLNACNNTSPAQYFEKIANFYTSCQRNSVKFILNYFDDV